MYKFLGTDMLPKHLAHLHTPEPGTLALPSNHAIPDKVRPLRRYAMTLGIKRPYLYNKATLTKIIKDKLNNG